MPKYLSGRAKRVPQDQLSEDRYQYLGLDQAEPNLSDPLVSPSVPSGAQYQLVAVPAYPGKRYWVPVGGGLVPGAITIFDEDNPVSSSSSITQLNFVGAAVTANVSVQSPSGHPGIAATITVIPVSIGENPPNVPQPNEGELWWESDTGDLYIYYDDGDSSQWVMTNAGGRGLTGDKGQKGEVGQTGLTGNEGPKGDKGDKGQKGDVEAQGNKGQKGEIGVGQKGQKGEAGTDGNDGNKGQKGEDNSTKGQKGEIGVGVKGQKGELNDKGQKGETGTAGAVGIPVGTIVMYGSSSAPSGWQLCNGGSPATSALQSVVGSTVPDLRDRFIVGTGLNYSQNNIGGSASVNLTTAQMPSHAHDASASSNASVNVNDPGHSHQSRGYGNQDDGGPYHTGSNNSGTGNNAILSNTTGINVSTNVSTNVTVDNEGSGQAVENRPPYYALTFIIKT